MTLLVVRHVQLRRRVRELERALTNAYMKKAYMPTLVDDIYRQNSLMYTLRDAELVRERQRRRAMGAE